MNNKKLEDYINKQKAYRIKTNEDGFYALFYSGFNFTSLPDDCCIVKKEAINLLDELEIEYRIVDFRTGKEVQ